MDRPNCAGSIGKLDFTGDLIHSLPNSLPEGSVRGLAFHRADDRGGGSILVLYRIDATREVYIFELDMAGREIRRVLHPYYELHAPPEGCRRGPFAAGIASVGGEGLEHVVLAGRPEGEGGEQLVVRMDLASGDLVRGHSLPAPTGERRSALECSYSCGRRS